MNVDPGTRLEVETMRALVDCARGVVRVDQEGWFHTGWWVAPQLLMFGPLPAEAKVGARITIGGAPAEASRMVHLRFPKASGTLAAVVAHVPGDGRPALRVNLQPAPREIRAEPRVYLFGHPDGGALTVAPGELHGLGPWRSRTAEDALALAPPSVDPRSMCLYRAPGGGRGFGGGPVVDGAGRALAMHFGTLGPAAAQAGTAGELRWGLTVQALLDALRAHAPELWERVRSAQGIVAPDAVRRVLASIPRAETEPEHASWLKAATVLWDFEPEQLRPLTPRGEQGGAWRHLLRHSVAVPGSSTRWTLLPSARQEGVRLLGSSEALRAARRANPTPAEPGSPQAAIDALLGSPTSIDPGGLGREALHALVIASRWFSPLVPDGPSEAVIRARLAALDVTEPLKALSGDDFRGRADELARIAAFVAAPGRRGALIVSGIGGSGKSALVAHYLLGADAPGALRYALLDFDRPALRSADAHGLLDEVLRQLIALDPSLEAARNVEEEPDLEALELTAQSSASPTDRAGTRARADTERRDFLGRRAERLARVAGRDRPLVLGLDSYEEVVPVEEAPTAAIAELISGLQRDLPRLRVVAIGRVKAAKLPLSGPIPEPIDLLGLDDDAAQALLAARGVSDPKDVQAILALAHGNPFILRLAADFAREHGAGQLHDERLRELDAVVVQGMLYRRILGHVADAAIRQIAHPALVLRRFTADAVRRVLAPCVGVPTPDEARARELFEGLARLGSLVRMEAPDRVAHRPDLRRVVLRLLEEEDAAGVKRVESTALEWLQEIDEPWAAAEALYHRMRLGASREDLDATWRPDLAAWFSPATLDELPEGAAAWLAPRIGVSPPMAGADPVDSASHLRFALARALRERRYTDVNQLLTQIDLAPRLDERFDYLAAVAFLQAGQPDEAGRWAPDPGGSVQNALLHAEIAEMSGDVARCVSLLDEVARRLPADHQIAALAHTLVAYRHPVIAGAGDARPEDLGRREKLLVSMLSGRRGSRPRGPGLASYAGAAATAESRWPLVVAVREVGSAPWTRHEVDAVWQAFAELPDEPRVRLSEGARILHARSDDVRDVLLALPTADPLGRSWLAAMLEEAHPALIDALVALTLQTMRGTIYRNLRGDTFDDGAAP